jgi:hypothetical protein
MRIKYLPINNIPAAHYDSANKKNQLTKETGNQT